MANSCRFPLDKKEEIKVGEIEEMKVEVIEEMKNKLINKI